MPRQLLIEYLDRRKAAYSLHKHNVAYTAPEIAELSHIAGNTFAKVVMIKIDGELAMAILPAHYHIDLDVLAMALSTDCVTLACEKEFGHRFPRCDIGAMPPFGHLYGLDAYMFPVFEPSQKIAFNAGTHSEIIRMPMREFLRLAYVTELQTGAVAPTIMARQQVEIAAKL